MPKYLHSELVEWPLVKILDEVNTLHELLDVSREVKQLQNERINEQVAEINALRKVVCDVRVEMVDLHHRWGEANALYIKDACEREEAAIFPTPNQEAHLTELKKAIDGRKRPE